MPVVLMIMMAMCRRAAMSIAPMKTQAQMMSAAEKHTNKKKPTFPDGKVGF